MTIARLPEDLVSLSARLGNNPLLVQAAGGNTSCKIGETLWVKASGKNLCDALRENCFVPLNLAAVRTTLAENKSDFSHAILDKSLGLRPSIETSLHALLPDAYVLHVHSVNTIAWAVQKNAEILLAEKLAGLPWAFVPYCQPGLPLTQAIAKTLQNKPCSILVLGNHGLVVSGATADAAEQLLQQIEQRLALPVRPSAPVDFERLQSAASQLNDFQVPEHAALHQLALCDFSEKLVCGGSLYPDHVVFLGRAVPTLAQLETGDSHALNAPAVLLPKLGLLVRNGISPAALAMLGALAEVISRIPTEAQVNYLSTADEDALLNWDAEKYRQQLQQAK